VSQFAVFKNGADTRARHEENISVAGLPHNGRPRLGKFKENCGTAFVHSPSRPLRRAS
jgi:hypothetical protein